MRQRFALFAVLAVLALAVAGCGGDPPPDRAAAPAATAGAATRATMPPATSEARPETTRPAPKGLVPAGQRDPAPDLHVTAFDGRTVTLGGFRGQPVVVNFFESW
jgi:cytochrome oxidase Cu insertion factor (SCO1/SenC/PrrC family)